MKLCFFSLLFSFLLFLAFSIVNADTSTEIKACLAKYKEAGYKIQTATADCIQKDIFLKVGTPSFNSCQSELLAQKISSKSVLPLCLAYVFRKSKKAILESDLPSRFASCVKLGTSATMGEFYFADQEEGGKPDWSESLGLFSFVSSWAQLLVSDCLRSESPPFQVSTRAEILDVINFHSKYQFVDELNPKWVLGGLSGLWFDASSDTYFSVTDSRRTPYIISFKFDPKKPKGERLAFGRPVDLTNSKVSANGALEDNEDLVRLPDGRFVVSSEVSIKGAIAAWEKAELRQLKIFTKEGEVEGFLPLPYDFKVVFEERESTCHDEKKSNKPYPCLQSVQVAGLQQNKGIESLAYDKENDKLWFASEAPTIQDLDPKLNKVFIYSTSNVSKTPELDEQRYEYQLDKIPGNGLSALLFVGKNHFLSLERSYDPRTFENSIRIFSVDLVNERVGNSSRLIAKKKILIRLEDYLGQFPPGFRRLDNFEGMTFGPTLENGEKTLFLVSDNNFNISQRTVLLWLRLPR